MGVVDVSELGTVQQIRLNHGPRVFKQILFDWRQGKTFIQLVALVALNGFTYVW